MKKKEITAEEILERETGLSLDDLMDGIDLEDYLIIDENGRETLDYEAIMKDW
ncbi:MAG: hypothetical protein R2941_24465 [Desulfobacterales bacterium]